MTVKEQIAPERAVADSIQARRARYHCPENGFSFKWSAVPAHQFLAERDRALDPATPTSTIELDISKALGTAYPATTPTIGGAPHEFRETQHRPCDASES